MGIQKKELEEKTLLLEKTQKDLKQIQRKQKKSEHILLEKDQELSDHQSKLQQQSLQLASVLQDNEKLRQLSRQIKKKENKKIEPNYEKKIERSTLERERVIKEENQKEHDFVLVS